MRLFLSIQFISMIRLSFKPFGLCAMLLYSVVQLYAQDSLRITLPQTEALFINKNLSLLAEKYNINIAQAQIIQAKLYPNPNFSFSGNIYNPQLKKVADISNRTGQYTIDAQQLILPRAGAGCVKK